MTSRRVGLLGGTFDPIHVGHLKVAEAARDMLGLSEVLLMTARHPPHRAVPPVASPSHRFAMVALAVVDRTGLVASDLEMESAEPSYTSATLRKLHARGYAPVELFFITGVDAFAEIATWKDYPDVLHLSQFVVVNRPGSDAASVGALSSGFPGVQFLRADTPDVSSSEIRSRLTAGLAIDGLVPELVAHHIARHGLYRG